MWGSVVVKLLAGLESSLEGFDFHGSNGQPLKRLLAGLTLLPQAVLGHGS
jgi:hypothetical protein